MNDEPSRWNENPANAVANLMAHPIGEKWVYRHKVKCPSCLAYWVVEVASPRGFVDPKPDPLRWGMGCLCGQCEARRRARTVEEVPRRGERPQKAKFGRVWSEDDERKAWGNLRHSTTAYIPTIERLDVWDGRPLRDDRNAELERIFRRHDGRIASILSMESIRGLRLDWDRFMFEPQTESSK